jgi:hypothetical protein
MSWQFGLISALLVGFTFIVIYLVIDECLKRERKNYSVGRDVK